MTKATRPQRRRNGNKRKTTRRNGNAHQNLQKRRGNNDGITTSFRTSSRNNPLLKSGTITRQLNNKMYREAGSDYIGRVAVKAKSEIHIPEDRILWTSRISPSAFDGTRMTVMSNLYERYRFTHMTLKYNNALPMTVGALFALYIDTDPSDSPIDMTVDEMIRQGMAQTGGKLFNFNDDVLVPMAIRVDHQLYYTGAVKKNARFSDQARAYIIQATDPVGPDLKPIDEGAEVGLISLNWMCDFNTAQINPLRSAVNPNEIYQKDISAAHGDVFTVTDSAHTYMRLVKLMLNPDTNLPTTIKITKDAVAEDLWYNLGDSEQVDNGFIKLEDGEYTVSIVNTNSGVVSGATMTLGMMQSGTPPTVYMTGSRIPEKKEGSGVLKLKSKDSSDKIDELTQKLNSLETQVGCYLGHGRNTRESSVRSLNA